MEVDWPVPLAKPTVSEIFYGPLGRPARHPGVLLPPEGGPATTITRTILAWTPALIVAL